MPLYTKKEFAAMCGMTTKQLATNALPDRRKVVYNGDYVDSSVEPNLSFLQKWQDRNRDKIQVHSKKEPLRLIRPPTLKEMDTETEEEEPREVEVTGLDAKKLKTQIIKMEKEIEKLTISNEKSMGEVIPVGLMDALLLQERQSILMESKNTMQDILSIFKKRRSLSAEESADISAEFVDRLNEMMKRSAESTSKAVKEIVSQFSVKRAKGGRH